MTPEVRLKNLTLILEKIEKEKGLNSLAKIAKEYDLNASYLSQLMNGNRQIGERSARSLEEKLKLEKFSLDNCPLQSNISPNFESVDDWDDDTPLEPDEVEIPFYKDFCVACGHGTDLVAMENEKRRLRFSRLTLDRIGSHKDKVFATLAEGDSMSPTINDKDTIWIDESKTNIKDGKIFVFEYGGLCMCKRLYRLPNNGLKIVSDNTIDYPEWEITGEQREENGFRLIGWVFHWSVMDSW